MTIGIYALYWEEQDLIYIGQSQNIEKRFKEHLRKMQYSSHTNYKVQDAFNLYGKPVLEIIEISTINNLNYLEIYWTKEFNSIDKGLNIIEAGQVGYGYKSNNSKYSELQIIKVLRYLSNPYLSYKDIKEKTKVSTSTINNIANGTAHLWLKDRYPLHYNRMVDRKSLRVGFSNRTSIYSKVVSPIGDVYLVTQIKDFALKYNLNRKY